MINCTLNQCFLLFHFTDDIDNYIADHSLPLTLLGASYRGVSVNDCIFEAMKAVQRLKRIYHTEEPWKLPID